jgi:hypothetical protein
MTTPPSARASEAASKGAVKGSLKSPTSVLASKPDRMATNPLPRKTAWLNVPDSHCGSYPRRRCSETSQDSKAVVSRLVAMPPSTRPPNSTQYTPQCFVAQLAAYVTQYNSAAFLRPLARRGE